MTRVCRFSPWWRWVITGLSALGLALSSYLAWHYLRGGTVIGCGGGSPCEEVLSSRWSAIGGAVPVSGLAAGAYLAMLLDSFFLDSPTETSVRRLAWRTLLVLVGAAAGSAVWFIILQKWEIGSFCPYCMTTHVISLLLAALVVWQARRQPAADTGNIVMTNSPAASDSPAASSRLIRPWPAFGLAGIGVILAGVSAACQVVLAPVGISRHGESLADVPVLDPHTVPLIGSPDAHYVVDLLFDYNCPHCQQLHSMLDETMSRYHGQVAFTLCPVPLNPACNPFIPREAEPFKNSCDLAKIALAVWVARRDLFLEFDRWMFAREPGERWQGRSLDAAREKAIALVGAAKFEAAQNDPWIGQYIQTCVEIYGRTLPGGGAVPKLVLRSRWALPQPSSEDDLIEILHDSLALPKP